MKKLMYYIVFFYAIFSYAQTQVGDIRFNDVDVFEGSELILNGAGAREKLYAMALYLDFEVEGVEDGIMVADKDATMAITIKITSSSISDSDFKDLIRNGLERATDGNSYLFENQIRDFLHLIPNEINKFDIFKILYVKGGKLTLYKNKKALGTINSKEFKKALFKIWLGENPVDEKLKENLLASFEPNPILGRWKTYDKKTGVALSIVQLYVIKKQVYGSIQRMMRISERDAVCYECQGADKNQNVEGLVIMKGLKLKGDRYINGKYTDIKTGEVSECQIWIDAEDKDILNMKYKGGGSHVWKRVKK
ncbi:chalcone isomerase family protein [Aquimarina aquimarini]|uniref:chalcone isomerase family protein n=1 Tax=Aquimarina aquimarini TaxID=1191734 RepID=UPI000D55033D|nr:chalcone isomerase family protein [Aquimarina aquimarini]